MPSVEDALKSIEAYHKKKLRLIEDLKETSEMPISDAEKDEMQEQIEIQIKTCDTNKKKILEELVRFPPYHQKHFPFLTEFRNIGAYEKSVFIMTKFPDEQGNQPLDRALKNVIRAVRDAITARGYIPRLALDRRFQPGLWDNVETYLLGCQKGVAIVENKYMAELNPNVTMEWGWMRGMNRDVLFLVEKSFDMARADITGLIQDRFSWDNPEPDITRAVSGWLP